MNFILNESGMNVLDKPRHGKNFLTIVSKGKLQKYKNNLGPIKIARIGHRDYLGYNKRLLSIPCDLLFTLTVRKQLQPFIDKPIIRTLLDIANQDFRHGGRLRSQGAMNSLTIPGTRQQKVLLFTTLIQKNWKRGVQILIGVDDAQNWHNHGRSKSRTNNFQKRALSSRNYYSSLYLQSLATLATPLRLSKYYLYWILFLNLETKQVFLNYKKNKENCN